MYLERYVPNQLAQQNPFINKAMEETALPKFETIKDRLPQPLWEGHEDVLECYYKVWEMAFGNLRQPNKENGFVSNYIDTAFNHCIFLWDSSFMLQFGKYATHIFDFQKTLDNFYSKQHEDGFICREISTEDGSDRFHRHDPMSTGPNILCWIEWEYYECYGNKKRLEDTFNALLSYHQWLKSYRTWLDGTYWSSGWGCGMDNQLRVPHEAMDKFHHGHLVWVDACIQQILSAKLLIKIGKEIGRDGAQELTEEIEQLTEVVNTTMWNEEKSFYFDRARDGSMTDVQSIGAYWALLAEIVPEEKREAFIAHLDDENVFKRPHRIPTLAYSSTNYKDDGGYWKGGVWAPTNYMVLKGLDKYNHLDLAYDIARNHLENVVAVYKDTGTVWENYAPEKQERGNPSKPNFVGWTGLSPITIFIEYVLGIKIDVPNNKIRWHINLNEKHGISQLPFGNDSFVTLICNERQEGEMPQVEIQSTKDIEVEIYYNNEVINMQIKGNKA